MDEKNERLSFERALDFHKLADDLWRRWVEESLTTDPVQWDRACESYITGMDELRQAFGHPPSRPRKRP